MDDWSRRLWRAAPRALIVAAPFIALIGIWLGHTAASHRRHDLPTHQTSAAADGNGVVPVPASAGASVAPAVLATMTAAADRPSKSAPALADSAELMRALTQGLPALERLLEQYPGDAQVAIALANEQAQQKRFEAAVATVEHAVEVDPSSAQNGKVMSILWRAAQSAAAEQSFLCLRKLGGRGTDVTFDLASTPSVRDSVRERAKAELTNYLAFDASADTRVAAALLLAPDCDMRKELLARAEREGGKRTMAILDRISRGAGCASSSDRACNACLLNSPGLSHALAQLSTGKP